ncbi:hypothetical protein [Fodinibius salsisoli]|uniref:DoxX protein n=1 Tax=Fodinibius salsisoli TaxID=2820877 RepID=A0ABT3PQ83_9BACT|nr:hypothetical protein [Fodinibius salsisoli]MCW9708019.1 hypothetical protein [Fodinibius salsisoli]
MSLQSSLEKVHSKVVSNAWLKLFTAIVRGWLAIGFIIPGLKKVANVPFAAGIPTSEPIGYFFDAFFQATEFYIFVGVAQVIAGILLLFPATTALGTVLYLPIIVNICFITVALSFKGTWLIAWLMLLANIYLLCWEFDKWQALIPGFENSNPEIGTKHLSFLKTTIASGLSGLFALGLIFTAFGIFNNSSILYPILLAVGSLTVSSYLLVKFRSKYVLTN